MLWRSEAGRGAEAKDSYRARIHLTRHKVSDRAGENDVRMLTKLGITTARGLLHRLARPSASLRTGVGWRAHHKDIKTPAAIGPDALK